MERRLVAAARGVALGFVVLLLGLLAWKVTHRPPGPAFVAKVHRGERPTAPAFALPVFAAGSTDVAPRLQAALSRGRVDDGDLGGRPTIVNFFASWCPPCKEEARLLAAGARSLSGRVAFVGIASQDFKRDLRRFLDRYETSYPVLFDGPGNAERAWGVARFPETFVVAPNGRVIEHVAGRLDETELAEVIATAERS
ncbi:MAG: TlpA disulfide reductase family protein [Gaiellales bacterium]